MPMLDVDGSSLFYTVKGQGVPLVFIHPPVLTSLNFIYQVEGLSQEFKVITFDIRGHGKSKYSSQPITYPLIVEDINRLLDHLNIKKAFICGYSTGGSIALEYMLHSSERALGGVIISGMSEVRDMDLKQKISLGLSLASKEAISLLALAISWSNSNSQALFNKMIRESFNGDARNIAQYYRYSLHYNCTDLLEKITLPILLVYGKRDKAFHLYAKLLHSKLPNKELRFIHYAKHQIPTKAANELNDLIKQYVYSCNPKRFLY